MSTSTVDFSDLGARPVQASAGTDFSDLGGRPVNAQQHDFSSLTANTKGEGTYKISTGDGQTLDVPYSNVPVLRGLQGTSFASPDEEKRFTKDAANDPKRPTYWNALTNPVGSGAWGQNVGSGTLQVGGQAINAMVQPLAHPLETAGGMIRTGAALASGNPYTAGDALVRPMVGQYLADRQQGGNALALENLGGQTLGGIEGGRLMAPVVSRGAAAATDAAENVRQYVRPTSSPDIVSPPEMAARKLSAAVIPAGKDAPNFIRAAPQEVPNVIDYAKRTNNPLNTQLEFVKAAEGNAQESRAFYTDKVLGPSEGKLVKTTGTGFGNAMQEGPDTYATLGEIDKRIGDLNKQLDAPAANADDARRALASRTELQAEASKLRDILHQNLAQDTGLAPQQIADIRQRVGRSMELANDANAAVTARMQGEGKASLRPLEWGKLPGEAINLVRGGPVPVADRAFQAAIKDFPGQAQALPEIATPVTTRPALSPAEAQALRTEQLLSNARQLQERARATKLWQWTTGK